MLNIHKKEVHKDRKRLHRWKALHPQIPHQTSDSPTDSGFSIKFRALQQIWDSPSDFGLSNRFGLPLPDFAFHPSDCRSGTPLIHITLSIFDMSSNGIMKIICKLLLMVSLTSAAAAQSTGQYASVNGLKMYYEVHGAGFPLVLIHGGGSTIGTSFGRILPGLAKTHQVIAVELQAHGHTPDRGVPETFQQDADDVAALLQQLHIVKADIFGFSNGASTTLQMAIRHPALVRKIVVASTFYKKSGAQSWFWPMMEHPKFEEMPQPYKDAFLAINPDKDALYTMYKRDVERMQNFPEISEADIESIKAPALIMAGDQDVVTPEHAIEMSRKIQHARLAIFPGGHGEYFGELLFLKPGQHGVNQYPALPVIENFLQEADKQ